MSNQRTRQLRLDFDAVEPAPTPPPRPTCRTQCPPQIAPHVRRCPWVSCRHHLALTIGNRANRRRVYPNPVFLDQNGELRLDTGLPMCSLDVANLGGASMELIGSLMGVSRERVRQVIEMAAEKMRLDSNLDEFAPDNYDEDVPVDRSRSEIVKASSRDVNEATADAWITTAHAHKKQTTRGSKT